MSSSDVELARALSRLLAGPPAGAPSAGRPPSPSAAVPSPDPSEFVRFRRAGPVGPAVAQTAAAFSPRPAASPAATPPPPSIPSNGFGAGVYTPLLEWAQGVAGAEAAFLMDEHGLVVAATGGIDSSAAEGYGVRLMIALDHARAMSTGESERTAVSVELGERVLTAFPAPGRDGTPFTVGIVGPAHVPAAVHGAVRDAFAGSPGSPPSPRRTPR